MAWKTIQKRYVQKHLPFVSDIKVYTLENSFSGVPVLGFWDHALKHGTFRVNGTEGKLNLHSNHWYEFKYNRPE